MTSTAASTPPAPDAPLVRHLLFVCDHNAGRSQMAQAFFERHGPPDVLADSAGTHPAKEIWPVVVQAMAEVGIDIAARRPKKLMLDMQLQADWAITMGCGDACPYVPTMVQAWDIPDPAHRPLPDVRVIRDGIENHIRALIADHLDEIRTDRTAHQLRLAQLLPALDREFADTKAPEEIRACADAVLSSFDGARVRVHVTALAHRRTRECLRRETCDRIATGSPS
jgi:protein-tyrosine-phosphatase